MALANKQEEAVQAGATQLLPRLRLPVVVLALAGVTLFVAICFFATMRYYTGGHLATPVDTSYITFQYARETASGHFFAYSAQDGPGSGMTSPLAVLVLAACWLLGARGQALVIVAFALNTLLLFASAMFVYRLALAIGRPEEPATPAQTQAARSRSAGRIGWLSRLQSAPRGAWMALLAALLVLTNGAIVWGYFSDITISLFGTLLLATLWAFVQAGQRRRYLALSMCSSLLVLSHSLGIVFILLLLGLHCLLSWQRWQRGASPQASAQDSPAMEAARQEPAAGKLPSWGEVGSIALLLPLVVALVWTGFVYATSGSIFPSVLRANWPFANVPLYWPETLNSISLNAIALWKQVFAGYFFDINTPPFFAPFFIFFFLLGLLPASWPYVRRVAGPASSPTRSADGALLTLLWFLAGALLVPLLGDQPYHSVAIPLFPLFLLFGTLGLARFAGLWEVGSLPGGRGALVGLGSFFILFGLLSTAQFALTYGKNSQSIHDRQVTLGIWAQAHLPSGAYIAVTDPGAIAYLGERPVLDLTGATDASVLGPAHNGQGSLARYLIALPQSRRPTYFIGYPDFYYSYWQAGIYGPELHRVHLFQNYMGGGDMVVYSLDWSQAATGNHPASPAALQAIAGKALVDELRVADLASEATHSYRFWAFEPGLIPWSITRKLSETDAPGTVLLDSGRGLSGGESFTLTSHPGHDLTLIQRTASPHPLALRVWVNGHEAAPLRYPQGKNAWVETVYTIPATLLTGNHTLLRLERVSDNQTTDEHVSFHYWAYQ